MRFAGGDRRARPDELRRRRDEIGPIGGQHGGDLGERAFGRAGQRRIGAARHPARAERQRLDLVDRKHQRRQREAGPQDITEPRLPRDVRALSLQSGDVAIERAQTDAELLGEIGARRRTAAPAQDFQEFEQTPGARHGARVARGQAPAKRRGRSRAMERDRDENAREHEEDEQVRDHGDRLDAVAIALQRVLDSRQAIEQPADQRGGEDPVGDP